MKLQTIYSGKIEITPLKIFYDEAAEKIGARVYFAESQDGETKLLALNLWFNLLCFLIE